MKSKFYYFILLFVFIIIFFYVLWNYFISIYEVRYDVSAREIYADSNTTVKIEAVPLNSLGKRAWFRNSPAQFEFTEGKSLVEVIVNDSLKGILIIKSKDSTGTVVIKVKAKFSLFPTIIEIPVLKNTV